MSEHNKRDPKFPLKVALAAALVGACVTLGVFSMASRVILSSFQSSFTTDAFTRAKIVQEKLNESVLITEGTASFAESGGVMTAERFFAYTGRFLKGSTGLRALAFAAVVPLNETSSFELKAKKMLADENFTIYEGNPGDERLPIEVRKAYYPVLYTNTIDPLAKSVAGYDLGSSYKRLEAMEKARDTGVAVVTPQLVLAGSSKSSGFILFAPIYAKMEGIPTVEKRRNAITGFIQAIFSLEEMIPVAFGETTPIGVPFDLSDLSAPKDSQKVYHWDARLKEVRTWRSLFLPSDVSFSHKFAFAGRTWGISLQPNSSYIEENHTIAHWLIIPAGLALSLLTAAYLYSLISQRDRLASLVDELEKARENIKKLEGILPICASCKKIREDDGTWTQVENYLTRRTDAQFSHGICPECGKKLYPEFTEK